jgi:hypothetical protein
MPHIALDWRQCTEDRLIYHLLPWSHTYPSCRAYMLLHGRPYPRTMIHCGGSTMYELFFCLDRGSCFWIFSGDLFLDEVCFFGSSVFSSICLIVTWCIVLLLHPCLVSFWVSSSILSSSVSWLRHESRGGFSISVDSTLSTLGPHSSPLPSSPCVARDRGP